MRPCCVALHIHPSADPPRHLPPPLPHSQGWRPVRLVRAPYLCAGDSYSPVAALDACVIALKPPLKHGVPAADATEPCADCAD
eukprot:1356791-Prymnesium_polylepis.1